MTDQQLNCETNQNKNGMPEKNVQPPMMGEGPENPAQPPMMGEGPENSVQPPMAGQDLENSVQPPMMGQGPENSAQPQMAEQGPENSAQPPIMEQTSENPAPNTGLLTLVFFLNIGYLVLFIGSALIAGPWGIVFLIFLGSYLISYIIATVLLGIGRRSASKEILFISVAFFFISMFLAGDPDWFLIRIPSIISTILVLIGTLLL